MESPVQLILWGVERAADVTTEENFPETLAVVQQLNMEFMVVYVKRLLRRPEFEGTNGPMWIHNRLHSFYMEVLK